MVVEHGASQAAHTESLSDDMHADQILLVWDGRKCAACTIDFALRLLSVWYPFGRASGSCLNPNLFHALSRIQE